MKHSYIVVLLIMLMGLNIVVASPGRLNSQGCHNSKTEGYHCHRSQASSSSSQSSSTFDTTTSNIQTLKKGLGYVCSANSECASNFCVHSICRNQSYFLDDSYCDNGETCVSSSKDCGSCENNGKCDVEVKENCLTSKDCLCNENQLCNLERPNGQLNGCYDIKCGDGFVDNGETADTCCLDVKCQDAKSLIKENYCNQNTKGCDTKTKDWLNITGGLIAIFFVLLIYNRTTTKKTHRYK